jgi:hypothetical protein
MKKNEFRQKPIPIEHDVRLALQGFIEFLRETGEAALLGSVEFNLPERKALERAVQILTNQPSATDSLIGILESCNIPEHTREVAFQNLRSALACAFIIGADGTRSANTKAYGTAAGRGKAAQKREPIDRRMQEIIAVAKKIFPPGRHGRMTAIDSYVAEKMKVNEKTASRHRRRK